MKLGLLLAAWLALAAAPRISVVDTNGVVHNESEWLGQRAIVVYFVMTDCPVSNSYVPEMNRIARDYGRQHVQSYAVVADLDKSAAEIKKHAMEFGYGFPVLVDPKQQFVRLTGASVTPEVAVLSSKGEVLYLGRIDNRVPDVVAQRTQATEFDLRRALDAVIAGKPVSPARTKAAGCAIPQPQ